VTQRDFWPRLAALLAEHPVVVDRPRGSTHPKKKGLVYPLDYGFVRGLRSGDGGGVDVWVGSLRSRRINGILCTLDLDKRDMEVKILIGCSAAERRKVLALHNRFSHRAVLVTPQRLAPRLRYASRKARTNAISRSTDSTARRVSRIRSTQP
jgi:inorganic pyrophosphatase